MDKDRGTLYYDVVNQKISSIVKLWKFQRDSGANGSSKEDLRSSRVQDLLRSVKNKKALVKKANYEEKMGHLLSPFVIAQELPKIVEYLFEHNKSSLIKCGSSLRDRFFLLQTWYGILRGKSVVAAELSDLCGLLLKSKGLQDCDVLIMQIFQGGLFLW